MQYVRLHVGCLIVILYVMVLYVRDAHKYKIPCNKIFDALMIVAPWTIIFDGITAWTVNRLDVVSVALNRNLHLVLYSLMNIMIVLITIYMYDVTVGLSKRKTAGNIWLLTLGIIAQILLIVGIDGVEFVSGDYSGYSSGFPVYVCYCSVAIHFGYIVFLVLTRHRHIPRNIKFGVSSFIVIVGLLLVAQYIYPEILLTSISPVVLVMGIYINFENPHLQKLSRNNRKMVEGFAAIIESWDLSTGGHVKRTQEYVNLMMHKIRHNRDYMHIINKDYLVDVSTSAPLHDIGKIGIPDEILQKPGRLDPDEYAIMKQHAALGGQTIKRILHEIEDQEFCKVAYEMARYHHERYNGTGYPDGLKGEEIPLHARIMAIADVFDAVSQKRCYREAMTLEESFEIIKNGAGEDFDPKLVEIFLEARDEVEKIHFKIN